MLQHARVEASGGGVEQERGGGRGGGGEDAGEVFGDVADDEAFVGGGGLFGVVDGEFVALDADDLGELRGEAVGEEAAAAVGINEEVVARLDEGFDEGEHLGSDGVVGLLEVAPALGFCDECVVAILGTGMVTSSWEAWAKKPTWRWVTWTRIRLR